MKEKDEPVSLGATTLCRRHRPARACRIRARCICNEGCAPPIAATSRHYARALHKTTERLHRSRRLSRSRSRSCARARVTYPASGIEMQSLARMIYTSPMPARGAGCRTSLLYVFIARLENIPQRAKNERASERAKFDTYVFASRAKRTSTMIIH